MDRIRIVGGQSLAGSVTVSGAKNAALPEMAAALLTDEEVVLDNVPDVRDVITMQHLLSAIGVETESRSHGVSLRARRILSPEAPYEQVKTMRASVLVLGPLLARWGEARVSLPGGCAIGSRPIDRHLGGLRALGAKVAVKHGYVEAKATKLRGTKIRFSAPTVTGTENLLMAGTLAVGETIIENAALEPEIVDLAAMLRGMGAQIEGAGTPVICVQGVERLHGVRHRIVADRIESGTYLLAGAISGGDVHVKGACAEHLEALIEKLRDAGATIDIEANDLRIQGSSKLRATDVRTDVYPGFPTDMQAQYVAFMTQANGISVVHETIFENRFMHVAELRRMGAQIRIDEASAIIKGPSTLQGTTLMATDLRASASLILAALVAEGETIVERVYHIDRGYERIEAKLKGLGARIERLK